MNPMSEDTVRTLHAEARDIAEASATCSASSASPGSPI